MKKELIYSKHLHIKFTLKEETQLEKLSNFYSEQYGMNPNKSGVIRLLINEKYKSVFPEQEN